MGKIESALKFKHISIDHDEIISSVYLQELSVLNKTRREITSS